MIFLLLVEDERVIIISTIYYISYIRCSEGD